MDSRSKRLSTSRRNGIDRRMGMIKSYRSGAISNFLALIQEKKAEEEERGKKMLSIAEDCMFCIFLRLPIDDLQRSSSICRSWNNIIMEQTFIEEHLHQSERGLLCLSFNEPDQPNNALSVESLVQKQNGVMFQQENRGERRQTHLHFLEIKNGVSLAELKGFNIGCNGRILGSCNGLVLLENKLKKGGLVVMNPTTRKVNPLTPGTIIRANKEAYAFAYKSSTNEHIAVHLFEEESGRFSCEILTIEKRKWAMVKGPRSGLTVPLNYIPVFANGALYWPNEYYILSMEIEEIEFSSIPYPKPKGLHDGIIELGGFLCFVTHELNWIEIWGLKGCSEVRWSKVYVVEKGVLPDMSPVCSSRYGRWIIFRSKIFHPLFEDGEDEDVFEDEDGLGMSRGDGGRREGEGGMVRSLFVYDFGVGVMNRVKTKHLTVDFNAYMPHVNSLLWG